MGDRETSILERWPRAVSHSASLDPAASRMASMSRTLLRIRPAKSLAQGKWLGHPVHPALTDLPIGFWTSAFMVDLVGGDGAAEVARRLIGWGNLTAIPTALAGLADAQDLSHDDRRVAVVHGALNAAGLTAYVISWAVRRHPHRKMAIASSFIGATSLTIAAHLGGHMVFNAQTMRNGAPSRPNEPRQPRLDC